MGGAWVETGVGVTCVRVSVAGVAEVSLGGREVGREALEEGKVEVGVLIALVAVGSRLQKKGDRKRGQGKWRGERGERGQWKGGEGSGGKDKRVNWEW